jgi:tripartite-type tricarboxylate transporter receptor subunit TctC
MSLRPIAVSVAALGLLIPTVMGTPARAADYPAKPIKLVAAFAPGGPADVLARLIAAAVSPGLGKTVYVENRPGAGGTIGARDVAVSAPDGYTLLLGNTANLVISPLLYRQAGYDPAKAFAAIALVGTTPNILIASNASGFKTVQDVIAYARKNPGKLNYSSAGIGTPLHLIGEMFKQRLGLDIVHIPYKSGGQATQAVMKAETQISFDSPEPALPAIKNGTVRGIAVTSGTRIPQAPDLPTMIEAGVPDFVTVSFTGISAPAGTPQPIIDRLNREIMKELGSEDLKQKLTNLAVETQIGAPANFATFLEKQRQRWGEVVERANIPKE